MKAELFPFQSKALAELRNKSAAAMDGYYRFHSPQVVSFTAPTGSGKTIIMASLIEAILFGDETYPEQPDAIFIWLSDSPQLNEQSKQKIDFKADKIKLSQCVTISEDSFDQETLDEGHIYFLNTQKLGKSSNLTKHSDTRQYTIWETLANTANEKSDKLYIIIDEAHRGMQGREAGKATTIMQKFLKGSPDDNINPMPIVIGMSATSARFNALIEGTTSSVHKVVVTTDEVRASGLLKDRIIISYPEDRSGNKDMAVLQAAADEWKNKWDHWYQYCYEQHYAYVNPVFVIQVQNGTGNSISATNLDDCLQKIEERTRIKFQEGEVVHTFGQTNMGISINGLNVPYVEPSNIAEDKKIKIVFFKESLSTGWDCPRAETMMSFRHATDATYIAQLLGRMIRTPMQSHINVDDTLNDVHLYLPYFDENTVKDVVEELQNAEGGDLPTEVYGESMENRRMDTLTVRPQPTMQRRRRENNIPGQMDVFGNQAGSQGEGQMSAVTTPINHDSSPVHQTNQPPTYQAEPANKPLDGLHQSNNHAESENSQTPMQAVQSQSQPHQQETNTSSPINNEPVPEVEEPAFDDGIDREAVMRAINDSGLLTYDVRSVRIKDYLSSLYGLARLLSQSGKYQEASNDVQDGIVKMIREYVKELQRTGEYDDLVKNLLQFEMKSQVFDVFGETVEDDNIAYHFMSSTDVDIDRQFQRAEVKLGREGVANRYGRYYHTEDNPNEFKIDVILYAGNDDCINRLMIYAEKLFHNMNDDYRRKIIGLSDKFQQQYNKIVSDGDIVSKHNFMLPETIAVERAPDGKIYTDHLFVDENTGQAKIKLNSWEEGVLEEEQKRDDYVCWLRNPPRKSWSLCIPYEMNGETKPTYPDFLVIRKDSDGEYVIDILEPHDASRSDNLGKAKGFAEYARQNPGVGRIQLIRKVRDTALGRDRFKRLDMAKSEVRDLVSHAMTNDELDHIFDDKGFFM